MRRLILILAAALVLGVTALPASAAAASANGNVPPGNSAIDQYLETIPGLTGNGPPGRGGHHGRLPSGTAQQLAGSGSAGRGVVNLVRQSGAASAGAASSGGTRSGHGKRSRGGRRPGSGRGGSKGSHASMTNGASPSNVPRGVASAAVGGSGDVGLGVWLPIVLGLITLVIVATAIVRRRQA